MKKLRIDPFSFFCIALLAAILALGLGYGAQHTHTHLREQWTLYAQISWWIAGVSATLWPLTSLLGQWHRRKAKSERRLASVSSQYGDVGYHEAHQRAQLGVSAEYSYTHGNGCRISRN